MECTNNENGSVTLKLTVDGEEFRRHLVEIFRPDPSVNKDDDDDTIIQKLQDSSNFENIRQVAVDSILGTKYEQALKEFDLEPITWPETDVEYISVAHGFAVNLTLFPEPEVTLHKIKDLAVTYTPVTVTGEDIAKHIKHILGEQGFTELTDEAAQKCGEFTDSADMTDKIAREVTEFAAKETEKRKKDALIKSFYLANPLTLNDELVDCRIDMEIATVIQRNGEDYFNAFLEQRNTTVDQLKDKMREQVASATVTALLLHALIDEYNTTASEQEIIAAISEKVPNVDGREYYNTVVSQHQNIKEEFESQVKQEKALVKLAESAKFTPKGGDSVLTLLIK